VAARHQPLAHEAELSALASALRAFVDDKHDEGVRYRCEVLGASGPPFV
jgi:hypothetical protein